MRFSPAVGSLTVMALFAAIAAALLFGLDGRGLAATNSRADAVLIDFETADNSFDSVGTIANSAMKTSGDSFDVDVVITNAIDLTGFSVEVEFDDTLLQVDTSTFDASSGSFILSGGPVAGGTLNTVLGGVGTSQLANGVVHPFAAQVGQTAIPSDGSGALFRLRFTALDDGVANIAVRARQVGSSTDFLLGVAIDEQEDPDDRFFPDNYDPVSPVDIVGSVTIAPAGNPPVANDDSATTASQTGVVIDVDANDTATAPATIDPDTVAPVAPIQGTVETNADDGAIPAGSVRFTPNANVSGDVQFTYTVKDTNGVTSNSATVTVTVDGQAPIITPPQAIVVVQDLDSTAVPPSGGASEDAREFGGRTFSGRTLTDFLDEATATDVFDGNLDEKITNDLSLPLPLAGGSPSENTTVTFNVTDAAGNAADPKTSVVTLLPGNGDLDGDQLSNRAEAFIGTDPTVACRTGPTDAEADDRYFGDIDGDANVGILDFGFFASAFNTVKGDAAYQQRVDFTADNSITILDFGVFAAVFGTSCAT